MPTYLCDKYVHNMNFCRWQVARLQNVAPTVVRLSADDQQMVYRCKTEVFHELCIFLMWMQVARF